MSSFLSPVFGAGAQLFSNAGVPLAGGKVYTYLAGTTTLVATYVDNTQGVVNSNPIILDSSGRPPQEVWLQGGVTYKFVVTDSAGTPVGYTYDNVGGVNDATYPQQSTTEWYTGSTPTYVSATSFTVPGSQLTTYVAARRVKCSVTAGTAYGTISSSSYGAGVTTVNVTNDSTALDSGLSVAQYGIISPSPTSLPTTLVQSVTIQNQTPIAYTTGGTSTAFTLTPVPAVTATAANQLFDVTFSTTCGASPTLAISGLTALPLVKSTAAGTYTALAAGDVVNLWRSQCVILSGGTQILVRQVIPLPDSVVLTGTPTAPTAAVGTDTTQLATTAYAMHMQSPAFSGTPTTTTPTAGDTSTKIASTQFVATAIAAVNAQTPLVVSVVSGTTQTAVAGMHYILTNVAATTVTLPASPASGDTVWITWTNTLTTNVVARNAQTIMGDATDMTLDAVTNGTVQLRFVNSSWRIL